jgi:hypothetical protein
MSKRKELIQAIEKARKSRVLCYFTGDRGGQETQIGDDAVPSFAAHLGKIGKTPRLDLLLYSRGGNTLTGFLLANALREFSDTVHVLVPFRAHSCATLIALGADQIVMGPFGQLSPIDPSITTPHGPTIQQDGQTKFLPVSVEDVANYLELARKEAGLKEEQYMSEVLGHLTRRVSPLALGAVYRAREQIGMLATKLLSSHIKENDRVSRIVKTLTRELLSHDYIIGRREAREIGLPVIDSNAEETDLMWQLFEDVAQEMKLAEPWNIEKESQETQPRTSVRALIESADLKTAFTTTYRFKRVTVTQGPGGGQKAEAIQTSVVEETWRVV